MVSADYVRVMGYKKPERRGLGHHLAAARHATVTDMRREGWTVIARCPRCHLDCWVSLHTISCMVGPDTRLWNRQTPCRRNLCTGRMAFLATPPGEMAGAFWPLWSTE